MMSAKFDLCPNCRSGLEIVCVRFRFAGTAAVWTCQNCAIAFADDSRSTKLSRLEGAPNGVKRSRSFRTACAMLDILNSRFRYLVRFLIAALLTAALLRHTVHIYGGITPEGIRKGALFVLVPIALVLLALTVMGSRRQG